jgi:SAM-dependent methyltransferase
MVQLEDPPAQWQGPVRGDEDLLLIGIATDDAHRALLHWAATTPGLHDFVPDFHRLQLEHWIWTFRDQLIGKNVLDIGAQNPRRWLGDGYRTFGHTADVTADIRGDLLCDLSGNQWDAIICTEVLEHCEEPAEAAREMHFALKPGGLLLITSPFMWPDHRTEDYPDFFRFTEQGWALLLRDFAEVTITPAQWTSEAKVLLDLVRRFEGWGFRNLIKAHTGYMVEAHKGG